MLLFSFSVVHYVRGFLIVDSKDFGELSVELVLVCRVRVGKHDLVSLLGEFIEGSFGWIGGLVGGGEKEDAGAAFLEDAIDDVFVEGGDN